MSEHAYGRSRAPSAKPGTDAARPAPGATRQSHEAARVLQVARQAGNRAVGAMLQRIPSELPITLEESQAVLREGQAVANDLVEEIWGKKPIGSGRERRDLRKLKQRLRGIANARSGAITEAQKQKAADLLGQLEDLDNHARAKEIERARAAGAGKTAERANARNAKKQAANEAQAATGTRTDYAAAGGDKDKPASTTAKTKPATVSNPPTHGTSATAKLGEAALETETKAAARLAKRAGSIGLSLLLPGPLDALFLLMEFAGSYAAAREERRRRNLRIGFAAGFASILIGAPADWVRENLVKRVISRDVVTQVGALEGVAENAFNQGLASGYNLGYKLPPAQRIPFQELGFELLADEGYTVHKYASTDTVWALARVLLPTVDRILEETRKSEALKKRLAAEKNRREDWSRPVGNKI